ncbi:MAG: toll/interleukin-1 receptor domain-containing protein [Actinobacteria bacterium]|nr:toll/interleukin-1 receptor domain-containing protein [Actinomycetota bacterium]
MNKLTFLKLFICYSHKDESYIDDFIAHLSPLKRNGLIKEFYDRKILASEDYQDTIDDNLNNADIICLCISANFLSSDPCMKEKDTAISLMKKKGIPVLPIIISDCGWLDINDISRLKALPKDGEPIAKFSDINTGWNDVYEGLKIVISNENNLKEIKISDKFKEFLNDSELLTNAHSQKEKIFIEDIYIDPELIKYNNLGGLDRKINSNLLIEEIMENSKILIAGENQSGKTTLCKKLFIKLREINLIPVFIREDNNRYQGLIINRLKKAFAEQYVDTSYDSIKKDKIIPIIDDFYMALNKDKIVEDLSDFNYQILVVDEIFNLNIKNENTAKNYYQYKIKEFKPALRNELIKKWINLDEKTKILYDDNKKYKTIDDATEYVNSTLGKIFSSGIMPSYPFFILSILSTYETFQKPLDQEITSQGYCYQALIYLYLKKQGVKNDEIDTYINFLSEIAFYFYSEDLDELTKTKFDKFIHEYQEKFNLPVDIEKLLNNLNETKMLAKDSCGNYYFEYPYLFYYFVAKYLAEHLEVNKDKIANIIANLHYDENSYVTIFIAHHTKNNSILDEIILNALLMFDNYEPATLSKKELVSCQSPIVG